MINLGVILSIYNSYSVI